MERARGSSGPVKAKQCPPTRGKRPSEMLVIIDLNRFWLRHLSLSTFVAVASM